MVILALTAVMHTHIWFNGVNTFVKVCQYGDQHSKYVKFYLYPDEICPASVVYR